MDKVSNNLVFLGCGDITKRISKLVAGPHFDVKCFYASRTVSKAQYYNETFRGQGYFGSYEEAIESQLVNTVYISTPPHLHFLLTKQALENNKHVIVEKPPFLSLADFDEVAALAENKKKQLIVAENYYYKPITRLLRKIILNNDIGDVKYIHLNALKSKNILNDWRDNNKICGGGALFEEGIHWVHLLSNIGMTVKNTNAYSASNSNSTERSSLLVFEYTNSSLATLSYSWEVPALIHQLRISKIFGTRGSITFESNGLFCVVSGKKKRIYVPNLLDLDGRKAMFEDFMQSINYNKQPELTLESVRNDLAIIIKSYKQMGVIK